MTDILRQAKAIPFRHDPDGLRVLLITSRDTGRLVIPKRKIEKSFTAAQAAAQEVSEEAEVRGTEIGHIFGTGKVADRCRRLIADGLPSRRGKTVVRQFLGQEGIRPIWLK
jgi:8-oxo-dGTP pyrophosphatase MutT (NUDIX family)